MKTPAVYVMTNKRNRTIYTGVTSDLPKRVAEHQNGIYDGFTKKYGCKILVYYEVLDDMKAAITREKQIKGGSRNDKIVLIESMNSGWKDLYPSIL